MQPCVLRLVVACVITSTQNSARTMCSFLSTAHHLWSLWLLDVDLFIYHRNPAFFSLSVYISFSANAKLCSPRPHLCSQWPHVCYSQPDLSHQTPQYPPLNWTKLKTHTFIFNIHLCLQQHSYKLFTHCFSHTSMLFCTLRSILFAHQCLIAAIICCYCTFTYIYKNPFIVYILLFAQ